VLSGRNLDCGILECGAVLSGTNLECGILECGAVLSGRNSPTFRKDMLPLFSAHDTVLRNPEDHNL
jgi:hypothetical protein